MAPKDLSGSVYFSDHAVHGRQGKPEMWLSLLPALQCKSHEEVLESLSLLVCTWQEPLFPPFLASHVVPDPFFCYPHHRLSNTFHWRGTLWFISHIHSLGFLRAGEHMRRNTQRTMAELVFTIPLVRSVALVLAAMLVLQLLDESPVSTSHFI